MFNSLSDEEKIYRRINYQFKNKDLLLQALTRQSAINEGKQLKSLKSFQQLEFIGDKVLNLVIGDFLLENNPDAAEGELTIETSQYVNNKGPLAMVAKRLKLNKFIIIGRGEEIQNNVRSNQKVLSDAMEALLGALWLDSDRDYAFIKKFILAHWGRAGLLPQQSRLVDLQLIVINYNTPLPEQIRQLKTCFEKPLSQEIINAFLAENAFEAGKEILELTLAQRPDKLALTNALINAIFLGCNIEVGILLEHGANSNFIYPPDNCKKWQYCGMEVYDQYSGRTVSVLQIAVTQSSKEIFGLLLRFGADPNWNLGISSKKTYSFQELARKAVTDTLDMALPEFPEVAEDFSQALFPGLFNETSRSFTLSSMFKPENSRRTQKIKKFNDKFTALHEIVNYSYCIADVEERIKLLITYKVNLNAQDYKGDTPLHVAAREDTHNIYDILIELGADQNIENNRGETSCEIKRRQEYSSGDEFVDGYSSNIEYK